MEYHTPLRPGLAARSQRESLRRSIDIMSEEAKKYSGEYQRMYYLEDITRWKAQLAQCEIDILNADPDEPFLQEVDYFAAAANRFKIARDRFINEVFEKIKAVTDPAEQMRLVGLIPDEFSDVRELFAHPTTTLAIARHEERIRG